MTFDCACMCVCVPLVEAASPYIPYKYPLNRQYNNTIHMGKHIPTIHHSAYTMYFEILFIFNMPSLCMSLAIEDWALKVKHAF